jgi:AmmeMemoRadiSam system protein A
LSFAVVLFVLTFYGERAGSSQEAEADHQDRKAGNAAASTVKNNAVEEHMKGQRKLLEEQGRYLLMVARNTIEAELFNRKASQNEDTDPPAVFLERCGTFVTLTKDGNLRGCIGHIIPRESMIEGVRVNALNAAFRDPRFQPVKKGEWDRIKIEVSVLTNPERLAYAGGDDLFEKLRSGVDGVIIKKGYHQATFLPQVWEQLPDKRDFLTHLCLKAGLHGDAWREGDLEVSTYQVEAFSE